MPETNAFPQPTRPLWDRRHVLAYKSVDGCGHSKGTIIYFACPGKAPIMVDPICGQRHTVIPTASRLRRRGIDGNMFLNDIALVVLSMWDAGWEHNKRVRSNQV